ncbi:MAG: acyl carrier protein [bacterium]|nr:acyl carrier protein [bacterium]
MLQESQQPGKPTAEALPGVIGELKRILAQDLDINLKLEEITDDVSLLEEGLALDSVVIVELINVLEDRYDFQFTDEDMRPALFENLSTLAKLVVAKTAP